MNTMKAINAKNADFPGSCFGMQAGQFLFLNGQTPIDLETGGVVAGLKQVPDSARTHLTVGMLLVDIPEERIVSQAWRILHNVTQILAQQGLSLNEIVHQCFYLRDMRDVTALERVILHFMPDERPSTTIISATSPGVNTRIAVQADFVVLTDRKVKRQNIILPDLDFLTAPFPLATRAGQYVFTSPLPGVNPDTGEIACRFSELTKEERELTEPPYSKEGESLVTQHIMQFRHARRILESQGSSLAWQLRQNGWLTIPMREFGPVSRVRRRLFAGPNTGPFTSLRVSGTRNANAAFEYSVVALIPPERPGDHKRGSVMSPHGIASYYIGAVRSGPYVIAAGEVPVDTTVPGAIGGFADLRDAGRLLGIGRVHEDKPILAKAWFVYQKLKACMNDHGSSMEEVVSQRVFMAQPDDYPALERIATLFYGPQLPPTTVVPILDTSPYPEAGLEIEVIAFTRNHCDGGADE